MSLERNKIYSLYQESLKDAFLGLGEDPSENRPTTGKVYGRTIMNGSLHLFAKDKNDPDFWLKQLEIGEAPFWSIDLESDSISNFSEFYKAYNKATDQFNSFPAKIRYYTEPLKPMTPGDPGLGVFEDFYRRDYIEMQQRLWEKLVSNHKDLLYFYDIDDYRFFSDQTKSNFFHSSTTSNWLTNGHKQEKRAGFGPGNYYNEVFHIAPFFISPDKRVNAAVVIVMTVAGFTEVDKTKEDNQLNQDFEVLYANITDSNSNIMPFLPAIRYLDNGWKKIGLRQK